MAMLTGLEILKQIEAGRIKITPFDKNCLNPNSYNLHLGKQILTYKETSYRTVQNGILVSRMCPRLNTRAKNETVSTEIGPNGIELQPGILYLGTTEEWTETDFYVPGIDGRSSTGRLGINVHATAGFGDVGFKGRWTLEITVAYPTTIYAGDEIAQIYYNTIEGDPSYKYRGRYYMQDKTTASRIEIEKKGAFKG